MTAEPRRGGAMDDSLEWTTCQTLLKACEGLLDTLRHELVVVTDISPVTEPVAVARQRAIDLFTRTIGDGDSLAQELRKVQARLRTVPRATKADRRQLRDLARRATVLGNVRAAASEQLLAAIRQDQ